jgi:hypothetical protein
MRNVTPEEVKAAAVAAGLTRIDHHDCGGCGVMVYYSVKDGNLFFNPACDCVTYYTPPQPRDWSDASNYINMQDDLWKGRVARSFGIDPERLEAKP